MNAAAGRYEKSSLCLEEVNDEDAWARLQAGSIRPVLGRADLLAQDIRFQTLQLDADWEPEGHVNIINWPATELQIQEIALELFRVHAFALRKQA